MKLLEKPENRGVCNANLESDIKNIKINKLSDGSLTIEIRISKELLKFAQSEQKTTSIFISKNDFNLTKREKEVLEKLAECKNNSQIARELSVSVHTIKAHTTKIFQKLCVQDRVQAIVKALNEKLINS